MSGFWRAVLVGAILGVLVVGGFAGAVALGLVPGTHDHSVQAAEGPVLIALVLPDADGVSAVRAVEVFERAGGALRTSPIDPLTSATVPGTSATTLAEAYAFGGGEGLARAYSQVSGGVSPVWVVVEPTAWTALMGASALRVTLPADMEVFDGNQLYSYAQGDASFPAAEAAQVMNGAAHLAARDRAVLRMAIGDQLLVAIAQQRLTSESGIGTNLTTEELAIWLSALQKAAIPADTNQ